MKKNKPFPFSSAPFRFSGQGAIIFLLLFILFGNVFYLGYHSYEKNALKNDANSSEDNIQKLSVINKILKEKYLFADKVPNDQMIDGAITGMAVSMGDIYTRYVTQKDYEEFQVATSGKFGGIGVTINNSNDTSNGIAIGETVKGNGADTAGLKPNDVITAVDGKTIKGMPVSDAIALIKGDVGTNVNLTVERKGTKEPMNVVVTRKAVEVQTVASGMLKNQVGYIHYTHFNETSEHQFDDAYKKLKKEGATSLILDLRDNPGGLVSVSINLLSKFVGPNKTAFITETKSGEEITKTHETDLNIDIPLVVLVNENSASASEILAGALQDLGRAKVVGTHSYGKGLIQESYPIDQKSALIITVAQYLTPKRHEIQHKGVQPDFNVELKKEDLLKGIDTQLEKSHAYAKSLTQ